MPDDLPQGNPPPSDDHTPHGFASAPSPEVAELLASAWDGVADLARATDLDAPSRLEGWTARDVLVHLGSWPEHVRFERLVEDVRRGRVPERDDVNARNALVVAAHADAGVDDIVAALGRARDRALEFLTSAEAETLGHRPADSPVGPIPLTGVLVAGAYELAVHALDVASPHEVPPGVLGAGVASLVDTAGALAARSGLDARFAVLTPVGSTACRSQHGGWTTLRLGHRPIDELGWPSVRGEAADVIDASAGRRAAVPLMLARRLRLTDVPGLLTLLPALETVPGLPGGTALRAAARSLARAGWLVGRVSTTLRGV
ncbi:MAG: hypothetical protein QG622_1432 [Actinomycetota bacterium]|nr:hypothetical protein [Actinomycetota bacterium]